MNKRSIRKKYKRKQQKTLKKQKGGGEMNAILLGLLDEKYVTLPSTKCIKDKDLLQIFLNSVTAPELFNLIGKNEKFVDSNTLSLIISKINNQSSSILKELGSLSKSPAALEMLANFRVNCFNLTNELDSQESTRYMKELHTYILECENHLSKKDVNWLEMVLGLQPFDDEFDRDIVGEMREKNIKIDTDKFKDGLMKLRQDDNVREICKQRILDCGKNSQSFTDMLFGTVSWNSYEDCFKCPDKDCVIYLDDNYKSFLKYKHGIMTVDKIKILIFMELRLRKISKYFSIAAVRIKDKRQRKVKSLLRKIYNDDVEKGNTTNNSQRQLLMKQSPLYRLTDYNQPIYVEQRGGQLGEPTAIQPTAIQPTAIQPPILPPDLTKPTGDLPKPPEPPEQPPILSPNLAEQPEEPMKLPEQPEEPMKLPEQPEESQSTEQMITESENPLEEKTVEFSKMFYLSYNGTIHNEIDKESIAEQVSTNLRNVCKLTNKSRLKVYRVRVGPRTVSVEIGIEEASGEELTDKQIKDNIVESIVSNKFIETMVVVELDSVKDIYFADISKYEQLKSYPSQHKRVLLEMDGIYPTTDSERVEFESKMLDDIKELLEDPGLDINRIHLENITNIVDKEDRVFVQFVILNGLYEKRSPHELIKEFKEKYSENDGDNEYTKRYKISNATFGDPSIILDKEDIERMKSLEEEKKDFDEINKKTYENLESNYKRIAYFGCDRTVEDIKNNMIKSTTSLLPECEGDINKLIRGF